MSQRLGRPPGLRTDGPKIRQLRVDRGLTTTQLGARIGHHAESIRRSERGGPVSDVLVSRLARALSIPDERVTVDDITVSDDTESEPEPKALVS